MTTGDRRGKGATMPTDSFMQTSRHDATTGPVARRFAVSVLVLPCSTHAADAGTRIWRFPAVAGAAPAPSIRNIFHVNGS